MAVTVNYLYPVTGIVAPTALQAKDMVTAGVTATADADAAATITHNMGLTAAELALGFPNVTITNVLQVGAGLSLWACTAKAANTITMAKSVAVGSGVAGDQIQVQVLRPHSIGR